MDAHHRDARRRDPRAPGIIIRNVTAADVPTILPPSIAANERSGSMTGSVASTSSSFATELKAGLSGMDPRGALLVGDGADLDVHDARALTAASVYPRIASRLTVRPGWAGAHRIAINTPGTNDVRSMESWRIVSVCP